MMRSTDIVFMRQAFTLNKSPKIRAFGRLFPSSDIVLPSKRTLLSYT